MLTQEELDKEYVDAPAAAKILNVTGSQVRFLCAKKKLKGVVKVGTSGWLIPRNSLLNYQPKRRGAKPRVPKREDNIKFREQILKEWEESKKLW